MVEVEIDGARAVIVGWRWTEGDPVLLRVLEQDLVERAYTGYEPFPALTIAQEAIARYGGRIVSEVSPAYVPGRVY